VLHTYAMRVVVVLICNILRGHPTLGWGANYHALVVTKVHTARGPHDPLAHLSVHALRLRPPPKDQKASTGERSLLRWT
jgi:hypothetical protein